MDKYIMELEGIFTTHRVCRSHGIEHAQQVQKNAQCALEHYDISEHDKFLVEMAALLHDADDQKFFPENNNYNNLRKVMQDCPEKDVATVIRMVELVSSSKNGDSIPDDVTDKLWMLVPRYADRLEAIGETGIERCYRYTKTTGRPLYCTDTPFPLTKAAGPTFIF